MAANQYLQIPGSQHQGLGVQNVRRNEIIISGASYPGKLSTIRRFFCLFVTFDLFLTILMWLICIVLDGSNISTDIENQVIHYKMKSSLFDVVGASIIRFILLLVFYGCFQMNHCFVVALTTISTCGFLVTKVFLYDWAQASQPVFQVLLILTSFILVWGEAWVLDIIVVPQESYVRIWEPARVTERSPLLRSNNSAPIISTENISNNLSNFYTPLDSPTYSDDEMDQSGASNFSRERSLDNSYKEMNKKGSFCSISLSTELVASISEDKIAGCKKRATVLLKKCYDYLISDDWKVVRITGAADVISVLYIPKLDGTFVKITGVVDFPADKLLTQIHLDIESSPSWNKQLIEAKIIDTIDNNTDLVYLAIKDSEHPKDFTVLRHRNQYEPYYISCYTSYNFPSIPVRKKYARTESGISCFATWNIPNQSSKCNFAWITNANLHGWIPQKTVNISLISDLEKFMANLRSYVQDIKS